MSELTIRPAGAHDSLARLAALDSAAPLTGDALIAETCGKLVAAIELGTGRTIADPFKRTADVVELLRLRARGAPPARSASAWRARFLPRAA